jgi:hypothetical protein
VAVVADDARCVRLEKPDGHARPLDSAARHRWPASLPGC